MSELPDMQKTKPLIKIPIKQVGVENVEVPFKLEARKSKRTFGKTFHDLIANASMRSNIDAEIKGVSMSRFVRTLKDFLGLPLKHDLIYMILDNLKKNLQSEDVYLRFDFRFPKVRKSPKSDNEFPIYYKCHFEGQFRGNNFRFFQGVTVQYSSYCPCSAELCNDLLSKGSSGFPHAQRSFATAVIETVEPNYIWLEDIIDTIEESIKTLPYPIIKREDEQEIARIAAENPIFVEDAIRAISQSFNDKSEFYDWIIKCVHEESIHTSEAIAMNWKGIEDGFNFRYYL